MRIMVIKCILSPKSLSTYYWKVFRCMLNMRIECFDSHFINYASHLEPRDRYKMLDYIVYLDPLQFPGIQPTMDGPSRQST